MKAFSNNGKPLPVGKTIVVFTDLPDRVGTEIEVVDTNEKVLNKARITHVAVSSDAAVKNAQKYVVEATVLEEMGTPKDGVFMSRLYLN